MLSQFKGEPKGLEPFVGEEKTLRGSASEIKGSSDMFVTQVTISARDLGITLA